MPPKHWISYLQCCDKNNHCIHITKLLIEHTHTHYWRPCTTCVGARVYMAQWPCSSYLVLPLRLPWARMGPTMCCCYCRHVLNARKGGRLTAPRIASPMVSTGWSSFQSGGVVATAFRLQVKCVSAPIKFNSTIKPVPMSQHLEQSG